MSDEVARPEPTPEKDKAGRRGAGEPIPADWSPRPFLRGLWLGLVVGAGGGLILAERLGPGWWRGGRGLFLFVFPALLLNLGAQQLLRPSKEEAGRRRERFRRCLGERWTRILTVAGFSLVFVGLGALLTCGLFEWPRCFVAVGLMLAGVLVALPAGLAEGPPGAPDGGGEE